MKVVFDTNVLLDIILYRDGAEQSLRLVQAVTDEKIDGVVTANTITDIYYVARKRIGDEGARLAISDILSIFDISLVDGDVCSMALNTGIKDYEDSVLAICAARDEADCIATNDQDFIDSDSPVPAKSTKQVFDLIE